MDSGCYTKEMKHYIEGNAYFLLVKLRNGVGRVDGNRSVERLQCLSVLLLLEESLRGEKGRSHKEKEYSN